MKKGIFFTMDAVFGLYLSFLLMGTMIILLEANTNYSEDSLALARLAKDLSLVREYNPSLTLPSFIKQGTDCAGKDLIASAPSFAYGDVQYDESWNRKSNIIITYETVCYA